MGLGVRELFDNNIKVHFAGSDGGEIFYAALLAAQTKYRLFSCYKYILKCRPDDDFRLPADHVIRVQDTVNRHVIQDSGLFTLMFGAGKGQTQTLESLTEWQDKLIAFVQQNNLRCTCVELDCQKVLGVREAWYFRERMKKLLDNPQINVFHFEDGMRGLDSMIDFSDYIALSIPELRIIKPKTFREDTRYLTHYIKNRKPEIDIHLLGWIRPASSIVGKLATIDLIAAVGDVDTVTAAIDPEAIATVAAVNDLLQRHNEDPEAHAGIIMDAVGSAMKKLEESGQIMDQKTVETMIRKEIAEHGSGGYYGTYFLTLAASGWEQADEESPDYSYIYTAELPDSTSALIPSGAPLLGSFHIAEDAGVVNGCETGDGVVKFYSKEIPAADISTCIILFGKGGGGESDLTVATREQLGHVKIGNGIEVTEDGTISANAKVSEDQIATSDDTSEMLKEIYGE